LLKVRHGFGFKFLKSTQTPVLQKKKKKRQCKGENIINASTFIQTIQASQLLAPEVLYKKS
jgi:hypothetical protein